MPAGNKNEEPLGSLKPIKRDRTAGSSVADLKPPRSALETEKISDAQRSEKPQAEPLPVEQTKETSQTEQKVSAKPKEQKALDKAEKLLGGETWLVKNGHTLTYVGLYLFSFMVLFRPYEIIPGLGFLSATAFYFAAATLLIYIPTQLSVSGNLTVMSTEVKAALAMTAISLLTMPIAKSPGLAWETFNDPFIKAILIFIVLINAVSNRRRLMGLLWLAMGIAIYLSYSAIDLYIKGEFAVEEYRVAVDVGGMFGNPNEMAIHLVMMTPIAAALGLAEKNKFLKLIYFACAVLFIAANMVTFSRGGFLALLGCGLMFAWKVGRKSRVSVSLVSAVIGGLVLLLAPGNYGLRMLSIFIPGLDPVGSSDQRKELLERSILVTLRNPWGIGIGNFPIVGIRNLQSHNAYTQVSAELGLLGLAAYIILIVSPLRKLSAIERLCFNAERFDWYYYMSIGLQSAIISYMISSFFASVAYNWFVYYLIAYAVAFRRIYMIDNDLKEEVKPEPMWQWRSA